MYSNNIFAIVIVLTATIWWLIYLRGGASKKRGHRTLPGPIGLPIIGHLFLLGNLPHRSLYKLSQKYGPMMSLRLGSVPTLVVSSPEAAELILKTHDNVFASHPKCQVGKYLQYGSKGMAVARYGAYWRSVRKFASTELLNHITINSMAWQRRDELGLLVESLKKAAAAGEVVDISQRVAHLIEDMTCRMLFGKSRDKRFDMSLNIHEMVKLAVVFNIADFIPLMGFLDLQGLTRRLKVLAHDFDKILETIIDDNEQGARNGDKELDNKDYVDVLLSLQKNPTSNHEYLSHGIQRSHIKALILDVIFGAIYTSQTGIEWVISQLLRHPRVPHESMEDIVIDGYYIPQKTRIIVNNWGLGRDPKLWSENVEEFYPERFSGSNIDHRGKDFQFLPFGTGRRGCPGMHLGLITMKLVVAQLVHSFNWELPFGMKPEELDMEETFALSLLRSTHLLAMPTSRTS